MTEAQEGVSCFLSPEDGSRQGRPHSHQKDTRGAGLPVAPFQGPRRWQSRQEPRLGMGSNANIRRYLHSLSPPAEVWETGELVGHS